MVGNHQKTSIYKWLAARGSRQVSSSYHHLPVSYVQNGESTSRLFTRKIAKCDLVKPLPFRDYQQKTQWPYQVPGSFEEGLAIGYLRTKHEKKKHTLKRPKN